MEDEKTEMDAEVLAKTRALADECWVLKSEIDERSKAVNIRKEKLREKETRLLQTLQAAGFRDGDLFSSDHGTYQFKKDPGIVGPKSPEDWEQFRNWMREKDYGTYQSAFKMHLGSLKAYIKQEIKIARENGNYDFKVPGLPPFNPHFYVHAKERKKA